MIQVLNFWTLRNRNPLPSLPSLAILSSLRLQFILAVLVLFYKNNFELFAVLLGPFTVLQEIIY